MPHTKLHDAIADSVALAETAVEANIEGRAAAVVKLLQDPDARDEDIWRRAFRAAEEGGAAVTEDDWDDPFGDLFDVTKDNRDFRWTTIWTVAISAAQAQYDAERILPTLWKALQDGGLAVMAAAGSVPRPLSPEAKRGPGKARFEEAKKRRGTA